MMDKIMIEFRVMFNAYDGKGDQFYSRVSCLSKAIELRAKLRESLDKGVAWIQVRKVMEWKNIEIK